MKSKLSILVVLLTGLYFYLIHTGFTWGVGVWAVITLLVLLWIVKQNLNNKPIRISHYLLWISAVIAFITMQVYLIHPYSMNGPGLSFVVAFYTFIGAVILGVISTLGFIVGAFLKK
jgi:hypothetical protein